MTITINCQKKASANIGIRCEEKSNGYKSTELGLIPEDWEIKSIQEVAEVRGGKRLPPGEQLSEVKTPYPYIRIVDMYHGGINLNSLMYLSQDVYKKIKNYSISHKDIFISVAGSLGIVGKIPKEIDGANLTENADKLTNIQCDRDFLLHNLMSQRIQNKINEEKTVGAQPKLALNRIQSFKIGVPTSLEEQKAIATALSDIDSLINSLDQLIAKKRNIKLAAMQQLLTGKQRLPGFSDEWSFTTLGDCLMEIPTYGINAPAVSYQDNLPRYIRITDITEDGYFSTKKLSSVKTPESNKYLLTDGDLVFARTGASVGKSYLYNSKDGHLVFAGFLIKIKPHPKRLLSIFLAFYAQTYQYKKWVQLTSMRSGQPGINSNEYAQLPLQLPSASEQRAIANILSDMDAEILTIEQQLAKARDLKQGMMQELLTGRIRLT